MQTLGFCDADKFLVDCVVEAVTYCEKDLFLFAGVFEFIRKNSEKLCDTKLLLYLLYCSTMTRFGILCPLPRFCQTHIIRAAHWIKVVLRGVEHYSCHNKLSVMR